MQVSVREPRAAPAIEVEIVFFLCTVYNTDQHLSQDFEIVLM